MSHQVMGAKVKGHVTAPVRDWFKTLSYTRQVLMLKPYITNHMEISAETHVTLSILLRTHFLKPKVPSHMVVCRGGWPPFRLRQKQKKV